MGSSAVIASTKGYCWNCKMTLVEEGIVTKITTQSLYIDTLPPRQ